MGIVLINPAVDLPVSLDEAKDWCAIARDDTDRDGALTLLQKGAVRLVERFLGQSICQQGWRFTLDQFCSGVIDLPRGPVIAVTSFTYVDPFYVVQPIDPASFLLDLTAEPQRIVLNPDYDWPDTTDRACAVTIEFTTKMATDHYDDIKLALLMTIATGLENREDMALPAGALDILRPCRLPVL